MIRARRRPIPLSTWKAVERHDWRLLVGVTVAVLMLLAASGCSGVDSAHVNAAADLPEPDLTSLDEVDAEQIRDERAELKQLLDEPDISESALAASLSRLGEVYLAFDFRGAARAALEQSLALRPDSADARFYLAHLDSLEGRDAEAADGFERVLTIEPDNAATRVRLAEAYLQLERVEAARELLLTAAEDPRVAPRAHFVLGRSHDATNDPRSALANYRRALELQPTATQLHGLIADRYRALGRPDLAEPHQVQRGDEEVFLPDDRLLALESYRRGPSTLLLRGSALMDAGRYPEAAVLFEEAVALDPDLVSGHLNLGVARFQLDERQAAARAFRRALELDPDLSKAHYNLGRVHLREMDPAAAERAFREALRSDPGNLEARFELARLLRRTGRCEAARPEYERYLQHSPADAQARLQLILCHARLGDYASALQQAETGHEAEPEHVAFIDALVRLLSASPDQEVRDAERALALLAPYADRATSSADVAELLAMAHAASGDFEEAIAIQRNALDQLRNAPAANPQRIETFETNLAHYEAGEPARQPWAEHVFDN